MDEAQIYGRGFGFPVRLGNDGRVAWSAGPANVRESIRVILTTRPGERIMLRPFGAGLQSFLFEPNNAATHRLIEERVGSALRLWEPRIRVQSISVRRSEEQREGAVVTIVYKLIATGAVETESLALELRG